MMVTLPTMMSHPVQTGVIYHSHTNGAKKWSHYERGIAVLQGRHPPHTQAEILLEAASGGMVLVGSHNLVCCGMSRLHTHGHSSTHTYGHT